MKRFLKLITHPLFVFAVITALECIPYTADKTVLHKLPNPGDNFRTIENPSVYFYNGVGKYVYPSQECFFKLGNPPFETNPQDGGVKYLDSKIAASIPLLGNMCAQKETDIGFVIAKEVKQNKYLSTNYLLDNFSDISHITFYTLWSLSLMFYFKTKKRNSLLTFAVCFTGGAVLEFVQLFFIEGRNASFADQGLNCLGAVIGILLFWIIQKIPSKQTVLS